MTGIPRDFSIDSKKRDMLLELVESEDSPFWKGHRKKAANRRNVLLHSMTLAFKSGIREQFQGSHGVFRNSDMKDEEKYLIMAIAIAEEGLDVLLPKNSEKIYRIAEEYASSGLDIVYNMVFSSDSGDPLADFEAEITKVMPQPKRKHLKKRKRNALGRAFPN